MTTDPTLAAELRDHLTTHTPSCTARADHLLQRAANALTAIEPHTTVIADIIAERARQDDSFGAQNWPDGTGSKTQQDEAGQARKWCEDAFASGYGTWSDILAEEVAEANAERDPTRLRAELIQVAAVACAWAQAIDRRLTSTPQDEAR